jgi:tRNA nucleotidyltransferase/poly(A) polymerase
MKLYLTGGAVRDHLIDSRSTPKDIDFAVEADSFETMFLGLHHLGVRVYKSLPHFVSIRGAIPYQSVAGKFIFTRSWSGDVDATIPADFTLCRAETQYSDRRHPDTVTPTSIGEDMMRRDFTMNALAMNEDGDILDVSSGVTDIRKGTLRCVGLPRERFMEDPLRILRAVRFMVTLGFHPDIALSNALRDPNVVDGLSTIPVERVQDEVNKALRVSWRQTMLGIMVNHPLIGDSLARWFDSLWFKATTEEK